MNPWMKFIAAVLLFGAWLALVLLHFVPAQSLVDAIGYTLAGLGVYHATAGSVGPIVTGTAALVSAELERPAAQPPPSPPPCLQQRYQLCRFRRRPRRRRSSDSRRDRAIGVSRARWLRLASICRHRSIRGIAARRRRRRAGRLLRAARLER